MKILDKMKRLDLITAEGRDLRGMLQNVPRRGMTGFSEFDGGTSDDGKFLMNERMSG